MKALARTLALGLLLAALSGCKIAVFDRPVTVSTRAHAVKQAEPLGRVSVERCAYQILIIPIVPDPKAAYEALLAEAEAKGGNGVIDFEIRASGLFGIVPLYMHSCWEATGIAAKL